MCENCGFEVRILDMGIGGFRYQRTSKMKKEHYEKEREKEELWYWFMWKEEDELGNVGKKRKVGLFLSLLIFKIKEDRPQYH